MFDRLENGAVNLDNIAFCKIEKENLSGKVHIIVERMLQRGIYAIFDSGDRGVWVEYLQLALTRAGHPTRIDGILGNAPVRH